MQPKGCENGLRLSNSNKFDCIRLAPSLHRQIQNNEEDGSNEHDNDRSEEADFENSKVGKSSQVGNRGSGPRTAKAVQELQGRTENHSSMRLMLDTCAIIDLLVDMDNLSKGAQALIEDPDNILFASAESMRELVVHFNNKRLLNRYFKTSTDVLKAVETELDIEFLPVRRNVGYQYSRLTINEAEDHRDPSDHIIISHAITERMPLLSSDTRFPFYREQGLDLIEY